MLNVLGLGTFFNIRLSKYKDAMMITDHFRLKQTEMVQCILNGDVNSTHRHTKQYTRLTSFEEKFRVCERPERLGSVTNPERSQLGLLWYESSMTMLLCEQVKIMFC